MKYGKKLNDGDRMFDYMNKGGKMRGYKMMANGGETDPPKKHKKAAQALLKKCEEAASMVKSNPSDANQKAFSQAKSEYENFTDDAKDAKAFSKESQEMEDGGKLRGYKFMENGGVTDPPKKGTAAGGPYYRIEETADVAFVERDGMMEAQSDTKLDAYNFDVPDGGFDAISPEEQERLKNTPFGKEYLSGEGSMDDKYLAYSAKVNNFIDNEPEKALEAANKMLESGNDNFRKALEGKSDKEKLSIMKSYMTDKKLGDFHGALEFMKTKVPTSQFYDPTSKVSQAGFRGVKFPKVLNAVGKNQVKPGDISKLAEQAESQGVDLSKETEESEQFVSLFMDKYGSQDRAEDYTGIDNKYFLDKAEKSYKASMNTASQAADERRKANARKAEEQKASMQNGGKIKQGNKGMKVGRRKPTSEEADRGVDKVREGVFTKTEVFPGVKSRNRKKWLANLIGGKNTIKGL